MIKIEDVGGDLEREIELLVKMRSPFIISFIEALKYETEIWVDFFLFFFSLSLSLFLFF